MTDSSSPPQPSQTEGGLTFKGWLKTSLVEFPGSVATVVFTGGCQFRCPFCYNSELVLRHGEMADIAPALVIEHLEGHPGCYGAVHITGGEPTLHPISGFAARCRALGLRVGLSTNGSCPERLGRLLDLKLLAFVAMDVKSRLDPAAYARAAGVETPDLVGRVRQSLDLLRNSGIDYELRTTTAPVLHTLDDLRALARDIAGAPRFVLQPLAPNPTLDPALAGSPSHPAGTLTRLRDEVAHLFSECVVRPPPA